MEQSKKDFLDQHFGSLINIDFLSYMVDSVKADSRLEECRNEGLLPFENPNLVYGHIDIDYFIAMNISSIHWYFKGYGDDQLLLKSYISDKDYVKKITDRFFEQTEFMQFVEPHHASAQSTYVPILFSIETLDGLAYRKLRNYGEENVNNLKDPIIRFKYNSLMQATSLMISIVQTLNFRDLNSTMTLLRALIELFVTHTAIGNDEAVIKEYNRLLDYKIYHISNNCYPHQCKLEAKDAGFDIHNHETSIYVNYGWLKTLDKKVKKKRYSFDGVVHYCKKKTKIDVRGLASAYHLCDSAVHSDLLGFTNEWVGYCYICDKVSIVLYYLVDYIKDFLGENFYQFHNVSLKDCLCADMNELSELMLSSGHFINR